MAKLNTIKMNPIGKVDGVPTVMCGPTLLHFLAMQAEEFAPEVVDIAQNWDNVWLAAEMQFAGVRRFNNLNIYIYFDFVIFSQIILCLIF